MAETKEEFLERIFSNQELENAIKNNSPELEVILSSAKEHDCLQEIIKERLLSDGSTIAEFVCSSHELSGKTWQYNRDLMRVLRKYVDKDIFSDIEKRDLLKLIKKDKNTVHTILFIDEMIDLFGSDMYRQLSGNDPLTIVKTRFKPSLYNKYESLRIQGKFDELNEHIHQKIIPLFQETETGTRLEQIIADLERPLKEYRASRIETIPSPKPTAMASIPTIDPKEERIDIQDNYNQAKTHIATLLESNPTISSSFKINVEARKWNEAIAIINNLLENTPFKTSEARSEIKAELMEPIVTAAREGDLNALKAIRRSSFADQEEIDEEREAIGYKDHIEETANNFLQEIKNNVDISQYNDQIMTRQWNLAANTINRIIKKSNLNDEYVEAVVKNKLLSPIKDAAMNGNDPEAQRIIDRINKSYPSIPLSKRLKGAIEESKIPSIPISNFMPIAKAQEELTEEYKYSPITSETTSEALSIISSSEDDFLNELYEEGKLKAAINHLSYNNLLEHLSPILEEAEKKGCLEKLLYDKKLIDGNKSLAEFIYDKNEKFMGLAYNISLMKVVKQFYDDIPLESDKKNTWVYRQIEWKKNSGFDTKEAEEIFNSARIPKEAPKITNISDMAATVAHGIVIPRFAIVSEDHNPSPRRETTWVRTEEAKRQKTVDPNLKI